MFIKFQQKPNGSFTAHKEVCMISILKFSRNLSVEREMSIIFFIYFILTYKKEPVINVSSINCLLNTKRHQTQS